MLEVPRATATPKPLVEEVRPAVNTPTGRHPFDRSTHVRLLDITSLPDEVRTFYERQASFDTHGPLSVYGIAVAPFFGNTPKHSNGGHLGSIILNACMSYQTARSDAKDLGQDPLSVTFDYLSPVDMGEGYIFVTGDPRGSGRGRFSDLYADLYQVQPSATIDCSNPAQSLVHKVRASALFGTFSGKGPSATDPYFGDRPALEDTPAPHPCSWYLPPKLTMISHHFDLLVDLEVRRRPRADYWIRFHPQGYAAQHLNPPKCDGHSQRKLNLPLHCESARRIDVVSLPTLADLRRPAMENVLKADPESVLDEPTRKWAYPTLSLTLRFLRPLYSAAEQKSPEWMYVGWRETAHHGRVTSEFKMESEEGATVCVGSMDSIMVPIEWYNKA